MAMVRWSKVTYTVVLGPRFFAGSFITGAQWRKEFTGVVCSRAQGVMLELFTELCSLGVGPTFLVCKLSRCLFRCYHRTGLHINGKLNSFAIIRVVRWYDRAVKYCLAGWLAAKQKREDGALLVYFIGKRGNRKRCVWCICWCQLCTAAGRDHENYGFLRYDIFDKDSLI